MSGNIQVTADSKQQADAVESIPYIIMKNPHVIIIGIYDYDHPNMPLPAVQKDIEKMKDLWKNKYKYPNVSVASEYKNMRDNNGKITVEQLQTFLNDISAEIQYYKKCDGLIIVYSGHGSNDAQGENYIIGSNNHRLSLTCIQEKFDADKCDYLKGKPKLLYFDCCRGKEQIENEAVKQRAKGNAAKKQYINNLSDFMMHYATAQNYVSWSNKDEGGHLINAISMCYVNEYMKHKACAITLHETSLKLNQMVAETNNAKQTAEIVNRLTYDVYIRPFESIEDAQSQDIIPSKGSLMSLVNKSNQQSRDYLELQSKFDKLTEAFVNLRKKEVKYKQKIKTLTQHVETLKQDKDGLNNAIETERTKNREREQAIEDLEQKLEDISSNQPPPPPPVSHHALINNNNNNDNDNETWRDKAVQQWNCLELQSWIQSLGIPNYVRSELIRAIKETGTYGEAFAALNNGKAIRDRFVGRGYDIAESVCDYVCEQLPRVHNNNNNNNNNYVDTPTNVAMFDIDKDIDDWTVQDVQEWIQSLNIDEGHKQLLVYSVEEMECAGADLNSCQTANDILESFPDIINQSAANIIWNSLNEWR